MTSEQAQEMITKLSKTYPEWDFSEHCTLSSKRTFVMCHHGRGHHLSLHRYEHLQMGIEAIYSIEKKDRERVR